MYQYFSQKGHNCVMILGNYLKKEVILKSATRKRLFLVIFAVKLFGNFCIGQNINVQQNQQNVNINLPVIEKTVYVDRYRTIYVDKPQPKRVAKKLSAPILLHGYLWVYPEDIGNFKKQSDAWEVMQNINARNPYGRNDWRIPTPGELALLENNADKVGLGDDIYMATNHANGVLRMVSTGKSVAEQNEDRQRAEAQVRADEQRRTEEIRRQRFAEEQKRAEEARQQKLAEEKKIAEAESQRQIEKDPLNAIKKILGISDIYTRNVSWNDRLSCSVGYRLISVSELEKIYTNPAIKKYLDNETTRENKRICNFIITKESQMKSLKIEKADNYWDKGKKYYKKYYYATEITNSAVCWERGIASGWGPRFTSLDVDIYASEKGGLTDWWLRKTYFLGIYVR